MSEVGLFWWRPKLQGQINLGDEIGKAIVEYASGRRVVRKGLHDCDMISVGSILSRPLQEAHLDPGGFPASLTSARAA